MSEKEFIGCIVEESIDDNRELNGLQVIEIKITGEPDPANRWHIYKVVVDKAEIEKIWHHLKEGWYMHFWKSDRQNMTIYFKGKKFEIMIGYRSTWTAAVEYGKSVGIPEEQLDFEIE